MYTILLLSLVTIAQAGRRICSANCEMQSSDQVTNPSALHCKCLEKQVKWLKTNSKKSFYEKSGIFYEPTENRAFQNRQLSYPYKPHANFEHIIPNKMWPTPTKNKHQLNDDFNTPLKNNRNKYNVEYPNANGKRSNTPIYLDINVHETKNNELPHYELYQNKMRELTEKHLKDCLDLHVIIYSRNQGEDSALEDILSERNIIYNKLSDSDLLIEINKKCNQSATIVKNSIDEIKSKRLNSNSNANSEVSVGLTSSSQHEFQNNAISQDSERNYLKLFKSLDVHPNEDAKPVEYTTLLETNISKIVNDTVENTTEFFKFILHEVSGKAVLSETTVNYYNDADLLKTHPEYEQESSTSNLFGLENNTLITTTTAKSIEDKLNNTSETYLTDNGVTVNDTPFYVNSTDFQSEFLDEDQYKNYDLISKKNVIELLNVETDPTTTMNYSDNLNENATNLTERTKHYEEEYEIPRVITTEFSNETITSDILGNEQIPNSDFVQHFESSTLVVPDANSNESISVAREWDENEKINNLNSLSILNEKSGSDTKNITDETSFTINGRLYFKYGMEYVPARFMQKPDGRVDMALDLSSLCKSNEKNKLKLMQAICNCIKFT